MAGLQDTVEIYYRHEGGNDNWGIVKTLVNESLANGNCMSDEYLFLSASFNEEGVMGSIYAKNEGGENNWGFITEVLEQDLNAQPITCTIFEDILAIGNYGFRKENSELQDGIVQIFTKDEGGDSNWGFTKALYSPDDQEFDLVSDQFGFSIAIDNNTLVVGSTGIEKQFERNKFHMGAFLSMKEI